jgi:hypothetical protein
MEQIFERLEAIMDAHYDRMRAIIKEYLGTTETFLEEKESAPEETEAVTEPQEVPEGATDKETFGATEDRAGEQRLAVRCHGQLKKRAQDNGGPLQKFAAVRGRFTRRAVPALRKGHRRRGPGQALGNGIRERSTKREAKDDAVRGTPKGRTCEKRRRTQPRCNSGIKDRGMKQRPHLGRGKTFIEALGQTFGLEVVERTVGSSIRLRSPSIWTLWKCRPPPKRKR